MNHKLWFFEFTICFVALLLAPGPALSLDAGSSELESLCEGYFSLGYSSIGTKGNPQRAKTHTFIDSGPFVQMAVSSMKKQKRFYLDLDFLSENDYEAELKADSRGILRLDVEAVGMYHNLSHLQVDSIDTGDLIFEDLNPTDKYYTRVDQVDTRLKVKAGNYPAHLTVKYWRFHREGKTQLRYLDENCTSCHVKSQSRSFDRVTDEVTATLDAHVGYVDVVFEQMYREFKESDTPSVDFFGAINDFAYGGSTDFRSEGSYEHDDIPDSRYVSSTLKVGNSIDGGLIGNVGLTLAQRENRSDVSEFSPVEAETTIRKAAANLTYIHSPKWTLNFRYRMVDLDADNTRLFTQTTGLNLDPTLTVRESMDVTRSSYNASLSYRPHRKLTFQADFKFEDIHRGNTGSALENPDLNPLVWTLPEEEQISQYKLSFWARPVDKGKLKLKGWYKYRESNDPAYGSSLEHKHEVFAGLTYAISALWGCNANIHFSQEDNNDSQILADNTSFNLDRKREAALLSVFLWYRPVEKLDFNLYYGLIRDRYREDVLFGTNATEGFAIEDNEAEYLQRVHTLSLAATWQVLETLKARLEGRYVRAYARFNPDFPAIENVAFASGPLDVNPEGLAEISEVDTVETAFDVGFDWNATEAWKWSASYQYSDYNDLNYGTFDGRVHTTMVSLGTSW